MEILCDFFVAYEGDAVKCGRLVSMGERLAADAVRRHEWKGFTPLELETVGPLPRAEAGAQMAARWSSPANAPGVDTWLTRFMRRYVGRLVTLARRGGRGSSPSRNATQKIGESPVAVTPIVDSVIGLARDANRIRQGCVLWASL